MNKIILSSLILVFLMILTVKAQVKPVAWWNFQSETHNKVTDQITGCEDSLSGYFSIVKGVKNNALKTDGYTTKVIRKVSEVPNFSNQLTIKAWVALQALPWNWSAIVSQGGYYSPPKQKELPESNTDNLNRGLIGVQFGNANLTDPLGKQELLSTDNDWTGSMHDWSNRWRGYIEAPYTGIVNFRTEADDGMQLIIDNKTVIDGWKINGPRSGSYKMIKGKKYPITITYGNDGGNAILRLFWSWKRKNEELISPDVFGYGERENVLARQDIIPPKPPEPEYEHKIFLGVDAYGHLGFKLNIDGILYECISDAKLPLLKWAHVAATYNKKEGMKLFINGKPVGQLKVSGDITPSGGSDLLLGMNIKKLGPVGSERQASADIHSEMVVYGLLDEIKIYDKSLSDNYINEDFKREIPAKIQALKWNKLPAGPEYLEKKFDAFYTRLRYTDEWEAPWRVTEFPDILIHFDELPIRFVFWRGTSYGGAWVTENGLWMGDQSLERSNAGKSPMGCSEHMSDKQTRYSNVRIIDKNDARIIIQWRYAVSDIIYDIFGTDTDFGWGEWADEYYYIYPDGVSTRHQTLWTNYLSHEWQETIVLNQPGTLPEDNIDLEAMTVANMKGESKKYSWENGPPESFSQPDDINIQMVNLKSKFKPFIIFEPKPKIKPMNGFREGYSHFTWWNHWPVAQLPNDGRKAFGPDRPSHSSLSQSVENSQVIHDNGDGSYTVVTLIGLTDNPVDSLVVLGKSWNETPELKITNSGFSRGEYSKKQRAFIITKEDNRNAPQLNFSINADNDSPLVNPAFVIKNWGENEISLTVNGKNIVRGDSLRYGFEKSMEGTDLVIWFNLKSKKPTDFSIKVQK